MALEKVYDYFHNYDKQTYQVVVCMGNEPSKQDIKNFENQYGINLPADFIPFLSIIGNGDEIFCFDKDNNIVLLDCYTTGETTPIEGTFSDCLMNQIAELEERKNKKIRGEDKFG